MSLLRLVILLPLAFLAGMLFERNRVAELCIAAGGEVVSDTCVPGGEEGIGE
ncbi:hypothetical protein [Mesobacterium pallidum]|uniref:hypothetical protein n=1 Tax=Mesobacterium pallidum TaxID=2872037 RepID=UPI001EE333F1|nr:hypothetical protein [Mesobacterium pallidum]